MSNPPPFPPFRRTQPADQADGLRRLFSSRSIRFIPVVSNPFIAHGGVLIERLCSALEALQLDTLLVDASERGGPPKELANFDLSEGIEVLSDRVSYLAARGLPVRWVDSRGSTRGFLDAVVDVAPSSQVVLVHGQNALQLGVFAAPRSAGIWDEVREEIRQSLSNDGAAAEEVTGVYGVELRAQVPTQDGRTNLRFVGIDGPRWMVRGVYQGMAATDPDAAGPLTMCLEGLVVDRGQDARPVREPLPLRLPREAAEQVRPAGDVPAAGEPAQEA